jgi:FAD/FMN-containing dehydrogenase
MERTKQRPAAKTAKSDDIFDRLKDIVGEANLIVDRATLDGYARDGSFAPPIPPRAVVKVRSADEVQAIVKLANELKTPLVPISSGGPHHKGDTVPSVPEAVIVDLSGMKKILNINRQQRMAVVEPGVTYGELQSALAKEGLCVSVPLRPRANKSVVASVLDMEPRLNALHQWNFIDPLRCTEVVWGDGNRMFTGEAGMSPMDLKTQWSAEKWQTSGTGPMMLDFYRLLTGSQGTMGIVTWASLKCDVDTKAHKLYLVAARRPEELTDFVYRVLRLRFSNELLVVNGACLAGLLSKSGEQSRALKADLPAWAALVGIAGREILPEERVRAQELDIGEIAQQFGLKMVPAAGGARGDEVLQAIMNPSEPPYWKEIARGAFQDIFFTTTLDRTPSFIAAMYEMSNEAGYAGEELGIYIQPQNMGTSCQIEFTLPYDAADARQRERVRSLFVKASEAFSRMGAYYLRPHGIWAHLQLNKDAQSAMLLQKLKGIFDPNNIMNTGKLGI